MTSRGILGLTCVLALALSGQSFPPSETSLLTVYGQALLTKDGMPAGAGYSVTAHNVTRSVMISAVLDADDRGQYTVVFVDYSTNRAAVSGDAFEVTLFDPDGNVVGQTARTIIDSGSIDSHLLEIDVNPVTTPSKLTTWGHIKTLWH